MQASCRFLSSPGRSLATAFLVIAAGCVPQTSLPLTSNSAAPVPAADSHKDDTGKRQPHAVTCVAFGDFHLKASSDSERPPAQKEQILDQARRAYQQALKLDPKSVGAYRGLARTYQQLGDHERTLATYQSGLNVRPEEPSLWFELGMFQAKEKDWKPALENLKKATQLDPENRIYQDMLAYSLARAGRYDESFQCFKRTVGEAKAHYNVARMLCHVKENELAKEHLRLAVQSSPDLLAARQMLNELESPKGSSVVTVGFEEIQSP